MTREQLNLDVDSSALPDIGVSRPAKRMTLKPIVQTSVVGLIDRSISVVNLLAVVKKQVA